MKQHDLQAHRPRGPRAHHVDGHGCLRFRRLLQLLELGAQGEDDPTSSQLPTTSGEFGPGCAAVPKTGAGSFQGMSTAPVATAASANPVLKTLVTAVDQGRAWSTP